MYVSVHQLIDIRTARYRVKKEKKKKREKKRKKNTSRALLFPSSLAWSVARGQKIALQSVVRWRFVLLAWREGTRQPVCTVHTAQYQIPYHTEINSVCRYRPI
ncbi:hypothetical protein BHM03_00005651 [Ensete ventricosum]|uniref:Uncharacterized protein n=1 Tax=Ensete ventricosum TaxID=4639 RepID=A0A445MB98_ENSVE|nr:hypothetical protein BHM03_00005651 [Ensete ventricosum]